MTQKPFKGIMTTREQLIGRTGLSTGKTQLNANIIGKDREYEREPAWIIRLLLEKYQKSIPKYV